MGDEKTPINWRKVGRITVTGGVGAIAAFTSFSHQVNLAEAHGQHGANAWSLPITTDMLIVGATLAMDGPNRFWPRIVFWLAVGATISANILAAPPDLLSRLISGWAPFALLLSIEIQARRNKTERWWRRQTAEVPDAKTEAAAGAEPKPRTRNARGEQTAKAVAKVAAKKPDAKPAQIAAALGMSESTVRREIKAINGKPVAAELTS